MSKSASGLSFDEWKYGVSSSPSSPSSSSSSSNSSPGSSLPAYGLSFDQWSSAKLSGEFPSSPLYSNLRVSPDLWSSTISSFKAYSKNRSSADSVYDENVNRNQYNAILSLASDLDKDIAYLKKTDPAGAQGLQVSRDSLDSVLASLDEEYNSNLSSQSEASEPLGFWATLRNIFTGASKGSLGTLAEGQRNLYALGQGARDAETNKEIERWALEVERAQRAIEEDTAYYGADSGVVEGDRNILEHAQMMLDAYSQVPAAQRGAALETANLSDELAFSSQGDIAAAKAGKGKAGQILVDVGTNAVQMAEDVLVGKLLGTGSGMLPMAGRVYGGSVQEARHSGASEQQQAAYGLAKAGVEMLTEKLADGLAGAYGKGTSDQMVESIIRKLSTNDAARNALRLGFSALGEGSEEVVSDFLDPIVKSIYDRGEALKTKYSDIDAWNEAVAQEAYSMLIGSIMGFGGGTLKLATGEYSKANSVLDQTSEIQNRLLEKGYEPNVASRLADATYKQLTGAELSPSEQSLLRSYPNALPVVESFFSDIVGSQSAVSGSRADFNRNAAEVNARKQAAAAAAAQNAQAVSDIASEARPVSPLTQTLQNSDEAFDSSDQDSVDALFNSEPVSSPVSADSSQDSYDDEYYNYEMEPVSRRYLDLHNEFIQSHSEEISSISSLFDSGNKSAARSLFDSLLSDIRNSSEYLSLGQILYSSPELDRVYQSLYCTSKVTPVRRNDEEYYNYDMEPVSRQYIEDHNDFIQSHSNEISSISSVFDSGDISSARRLFDSLFSEIVESGLSLNQVLYSSPELQRVHQSLYRTSKVTPVRRNDSNLVDDSSRDSSADIPYRPIPSVDESQQLDKDYFDSLKSEVENGAPSPASTEGIEDAINEVRSTPLESNQSPGYIDSLTGEQQASLGDDKSASDYDSSDAVLDDLSSGNISLDNAKRILGEMSSPSFEAPKGYTTYHEGAKATDYRPGYTVFFPNAESVPAGMHISNSTQTRKNVDDGSVAAYLPKDDSGFARSWVASLSSDSEISSAIENFKSILDSGREFSSTETAQIVALNNLLKSRKNESTASKGRFDAFVKDVYTPAMSLAAQSYRQFQSGKKDYDPVAQSAAIDKIISSLGLNEEQAKKLDALFYGSEDGDSKGLLNRLADVFNSYTELQNRLSAYKNDLSDTKLQNQRNAAQSVILGKLNADMQYAHQESVNEINEFLSSAASQSAISGLTNLPEGYLKDKSYWHKQMSTALQMLFSDTGTPIRSDGVSDAEYDSLVSRAYHDKLTDIANKTGIWFFSTPIEQPDGSRSFESYATLGRNGPRIFNLDNFFALSNSSPDSYDDFIKGNDEVRENMKELILEQARILGTDTFSKKGKWALKSLLDEFGSDFDYLVKVASQQQGRIARAAGKAKLLDKIRSYQLNALLLTLPSIERNIGSNTVFSFLDTFSGNTLGKAFDSVLGSLTGVQGIPGKESYLTDASLLRSSWQAFRKSIFEVALDVDPSNYQGYLADANLEGSPWDANGNVLNKVMSRWTQLTSYALGSTDVFFREAAQRSTQEAFKNAGIDVDAYRSLYGDEKFYSPLSQEPITVREAEKIINDIATSTGDYRLFTDKTLVNQAVTWLVNNLNGVDPNTGKYRSFGLGSIVAPVIKVPLNLASRAFEFTPLGAFRTVGQLARTVAAAKNHTLTAQQQRATSMSLARSVTGLGLAAILSSAFKAGIIKDYDDEDDKDVREYNRLHGRKGIMINWSAFLRAISGESTEFREGDHLSSAEWLEPIDSMFRFASALASDGSSSVSDIFRDSWSSSWNSVTSLPFFHTYTDIISELWNAATDNDFTFNDVLGTAGDVAISGANQMIPNFVRNLAKGTDPYERYKSSDSFGDSLVYNLMYDIPGLREALPVRKDALGEDVVQAGGNPYKSFANALLIPGTWSDYDNSELGSQLLDLAYSTGEMNVIPSKSPPDKFTFNGEDVYLSEAQQNSYYSAYTETYRKFADEFLNSNYADLLSEDAKADILTSLAEKSKDYGKLAVLGDEYEDFKESSPKFETLRYAYSALNDSDGSEGADVYSKVYKSLSRSEKQFVSENSSLGRQSLIKAVQSDVPLDVYYTAKSYVDFLSDVKDYSATDEKTAFKSWVESSLPTHSLSSSQKSGLLNSFDFTSQIPAETASYDKLRDAGFDPVKSRNYYEVHSSLPEPFHSGDELFLDKADNIGRYAAASDSPDDFLTSLEVFKSDFSQEAFFYYFYYQNPDAYSEEFIEDAYDRLGWTSKFSSSKRSNFKKIKKATGK